MKKYFILAIKTALIVVGVFLVLWSISVIALLNGWINVV